MLHAKRDLYLLAFDGVVQLLKRSEAPDAGAILEAVKDIFSDICDDWRDLTHGARRDAADAADAARRASVARERAEASMAELYALAKNAEAESRRVTEERDALVEELRDARARCADAERLSREAIASAKARVSMRSGLESFSLGSGGAGSSARDAAASSERGAGDAASADPEPPPPNRTPNRTSNRTSNASNASAPTLVDSEEAKRREASRRLEARLEYRPPPEAMPSYDSDPGSPAADSASESASDHSPARRPSPREPELADADVTVGSAAGLAALRVSNSRGPAGAPPVAPSTASPSARKTLEALQPGALERVPDPDRPPSPLRCGARREQACPDGPWTPPAPPRAAAARGLGRGGAGQFGPDSL